MFWVEVPKEGCSPTILNCDLSSSVGTPPRVPGSNYLWLQLPATLRSQQQVYRTSTHEWVNPNEAAQGTDSSALMWEEAADPSSQRGRKVAGQDRPLSTATAGYRDLLKAGPLSPQTQRERWLGMPKHEIGLYFATILCIYSLTRQNFLWTNLGIYFIFITVNNMSVGHSMDFVNSWNIFLFVFSWYI